VQPDDTHLAAGMTDGSFSIRRRQPKASEAADEAARKETLRSGSYEFFMGGDFEHIGEGRGRKPKVPRGAPATSQGLLGRSEEVKVRQEKRKKLRRYDVMLKRFQYGAALDAALQSVSICGLEVYELDAE